MARDVNDIVVLGFGSWSDVFGLPTLGFGSLVAVNNVFSCALITVRPAFGGVVRIAGEYGGTVNVRPAYDGVIKVNDC